jgi:hypothetical protein
MTMIILSRRAALAGLASLSVPAGAAAAVPEQETPRSQKEIAERVHSLASELSELLNDLDDGQWEVRAKPLFRGAVNYDIQPVYLPPRIRLEQGLAITRCALNELRPGDWRVMHDVAVGFVAISRFDR